MLLGEANDYYGRVDSPIGSFPPEDDRVTAVAEWPLRDEVIDWDVVIEGAMPSELPLEEVDYPEDMEGDLQLLFDIDASDLIVHADSTLVMGTFGERLEEVGAIDMFITDEAGYESYLNGEESVPVYTRAIGIDGTTGGVILSTEQSWYIVFANTWTVSSSVVGSIELTAQVFWQEDWVESDSLVAELVVPPGEHLAITLSPCWGCAR